MLPTHTHTHTHTLRGRRGTWWHSPSFHVAGGHKLTSTVVLRGRRGTHGTGWRAWSGFVACDAAALCVAGVALGDIHLRFTWQAWHELTSTIVLRGRRGTHGTGWHAWSGFVACDAAALCVAGVALGDIHLRFTWQAWHKLASTVVLRGRRGTHGTGWRAWSGFVACDAAALCVAGMALGDIHLRFTWQAWHKLASTVVLRGRRGTHGTGWRAWSGFVACDAAALCVAGVALGDIHLRFTWQAWHKLASTVVLRGSHGIVGGRICRLWRRGTLRGRRGTWWHSPSFHVAGWHELTSTVVLRGRRGTHGTRWRAWSGFVPCDAAALCVAGVALGDIHLRFTWQAWHKLTSTVVSRGRHGAWWHHVTSTFVLRGRCATWRHAPSFCHTPSFTHHLWHTIFDTPSLTPHHLSHTDFVTRHLSHTTLSHTNFVTHHLSHTNFVTHHLSHTSLSHPTFHTPSFTHHIVTHHLSHTPLCHIPSLTHRFVTHHFVTPHLSYTIFHTSHCHTPLCHIPSLTHRFVSHHFVTHHLSHTIFHTPLCHTPSFTTPSFTHHFVTHHLSPHHLSHTTLSHTIFHHTIFNTTLSHTIFRQTIFHTPHCHTPSFPHNFVTRPLSHTTFAHTIFHTPLCHTHYLS